MQFVARIYSLSFKDANRVVEISVSESKNPSFLSLELKHPLVSNQEDIRATQEEIQVAGSYDERVAAVCLSNYVYLLSSSSMGSPNYRLRITSTPVLSPESRNIKVDEDGRLMSTKWIEARKNHFYVLQSDIENLSSSQSSENSRSSFQKDQDLAEFSLKNYGFKDYVLIIRSERMYRDRLI